MRLAMLFVSLVLGQVGFAQGFVRIPSPRRIALGGSEVADARDLRSAFPALRPDSASVLEADFAPVPTGLDGSWSASASGLYALDPINRIGASFSRYQYQNIYASDELGVQYSRSFRVDSGRRATGGVRLHYYEIPFQGTAYLP